MVMFPTDEAHLPIKGWTLRQPWGEVAPVRGEGTMGT
jgi:hypothetical protein